MKKEYKENLQEQLNESEAKLVLIYRSLNKKDKKKLVNFVKEEANKSIVSLTI